MPVISPSEPPRRATRNVPSKVIAIILACAFSGLLVGFVAGAGERSVRPSPNKTHQANIPQTTSPFTPFTPLSTPPSAPVPSPAETLHLGCPELTISSPLSNPDGTLTYDMSIQAKDDNTRIICDIPNENPVTADDITCRLWLVPQGSDPENAPGTHFSNDTYQLQHPETFNQLFPQEIPNALIFDPPTLGKTQPCVRGGATWRATISPSVPSGDYFLVGLTDWQGKSSNWTWIAITVDGKR